MGKRNTRNLVLALVVCMIAALAAAGCGGGSNTTTVTESAASGEAGAETSGGESSGEANPLAGISPPSGSKLLDSKSSNDVFYERYSTSTQPKQVEATYKSELTGSGFSIVSSGGSGGGWGPYGGSDYGLTAKREDEYVDLQAGGEKGSTSYFELCATNGDGSRDDCNELSNQSNQDTDSGGSGSGSDSESTQSGGS